MRAYFLLKELRAVSSTEICNATVITKQIPSSCKHPSAMKSLDIDGRTEELPRWLEYGHALGLSEGTNQTSSGVIAHRLDLY
jgi:hypothetical protein